MSGATTRTRNWSSVLKQNLPNLLAVGLDPIHLAIVYEYGTWGRRNTGSKLLRGLIACVNAHDSRIPARCWGRFFQGEDVVSLTAEEQIMRRKIVSGALPLTLALRIKERIEVGAPLLSRLEFIEGLAAIAALHKEDMQETVPGPN